MRLYLNCFDAIKDIGRELKKCATIVHTQSYQNKDISKDDNFSTKEIQAFEFCILNTDDKDTMPNATVDWCKAEFKERISKDDINPGEAWKMRKEVWEEFLVDGEFDYTYNERISWQIPLVIEELRKNPETRQAIIEIHSNADDLEFVGGKKRIPCSMFYQFMIRDGKLDIIYVMRSTDFATHFQNDIWLAAELRRHIARELNLERGKFIMFASSLHIYKKDWEKLSNY